MMRNFQLATAIAALCLPGAAVAAPAGAIDCPAQGLTATQRAALGAALVDDEAGKATGRAHDLIAKPADSCAKAGHWTPNQTDTAINWTIWKVMADELERRSGLAPADLALITAYVDEDPRRVAGMDHFTDAQIGQLIAALRARGAHLHDYGNDTVRELGFVMMLKEMKAQEAEFTAK